MPVDTNILHCEVCFTKFTFITRRHWCRLCLKTICSGCSTSFNKGDLKALLQRQHPGNHCRLCDAASRCPAEDKRLSASFQRHRQSLLVPNSQHSVAGSHRALAPGAQVVPEPTTTTTATATNGPRRVASAEPGRGRRMSLGDRARNQSVSPRPMLMRRTSVSFVEEENDENATPSKQVRSHSPIDEGARPQGILCPRATAANVQ